MHKSPAERKAAQRVMTEGMRQHRAMVLICLISKAVRKSVKADR